MALGTSLIHLVWLNWSVCLYNYIFVGNVTKSQAENISALTLTHWGWVTHICISKLTIIGSDNGLSPARRQALVWTNVKVLLITPLGTNFSGILIEIHTFSFKKIHLKKSSGKWLPLCPGLNVLRFGFICCNFTPSKDLVSLRWVTSTSSFSESWLNRKMLSYQYFLCR